MRLTYEISANLYMFRETLDSFEEKLNKNPPNKDVNFMLKRFEDAASQLSDSIRKQVEEELNVCDENIV